MFGMLKMIFDVPLPQSTRATTVATAATSTPNILPVSAPRIELIPEPTQSTPATTVVITATLTPGILPASTIPRSEATPKVRTINTHNNRRSDTYAQAPKEKSGKTPARPVP